MEFNNNNNSTRTAVPEGDNKKETASVCLRRTDLSQIALANATAGWRFAVNGVGANFNKGNCCVSTNETPNSDWLDRALRDELLNSSEFWYLEKLTGSAAERGSLKPMSPRSVRRDSFIGKSHYSLKEWTFTVVGNPKCVERHSVDPLTHRYTRAGRQRMWQPNVTEGETR
ncbi:hypothetical protein CBL_00963 [Carabus blaptoides fortunei]